ncbi:hypothetical protein [Thalassotalea euphylliae]|uniref:Uncharacterized protein n=1 Tax=Thalassotalea euphylliae TaxID=1655234 RepID=A0A3E0U7K3_9GAMM|nr:hypothetical protein [Thalassotalea euphylliae]REL32523.1 hypothetical protein DXX94_18405 [Thalassotalea euphylliae]
MSITAIALGIAKLLDVDDWVIDKLTSSDNQAVNLAGKVVEAALDITGASSPKVALISLEQNTEYRYQLDKRLQEQKHELLMAAFADRSDARDMYKAHHSQADQIAKGIMRWNLPVVLLLVIANCLVVFYFKDNAALLAIVCNAIGMAMQKLFDERQAVTAFFFGSSLGSKQKDAAANSQLNISPKHQ